MHRAERVRFMWFLKVFRQSLLLPYANNDLIGRVRRSRHLPRLELCTRPVIRPAQLSDAPHIFRLIQNLSGDGTLLFRPLSEIENCIDRFVIAETYYGEFLGCAASHRYGTHLAEVRSIATLLQARGFGTGSTVLRRILDDVRPSGTGCACLFSRIPSFFARYGFHTVPLATMKDKLAGDCVHCPRRGRCDEIAMVSRELPVYWSSYHGNYLVQMGR
jgi:amino-acid N-acetyltransferase